MQENMQEDAELICKDDLGQVTCEPGWQWSTEDRSFEDYDLWYVWDGAGEMVLNGIAYTLAKGSCFLFRPGDRASASQAPDNPLTVTYIHFGVGARRRAELDNLSSYRSVRDTVFLETLLSRYVQNARDRAFRYEREAELLLSLMLQQLERQQWEERNGFVRGERLDRIRETANYIRQYPGVRHTVIGLAERAGLSPRYFSLKFRESMRMTVAAFIVEARITRAEHLLRCHNMTVAEVADLLGYHDLPFFSRQFKRFRGLSPSQLRK
jgi:AraC-like DNA-binding protein